MTIAEATKYSIKKLSNLYEESEAAAIIDWYFADALKLSKIDRKAKPNELLSEEQWRVFKSHIERLASGEPIQYILKSAYFYGLAFEVNAATLIPRPETEELVDYLIKQNKQENNLHILDIGTGSGCIPISIKKNLPAANVSSIDISEEALEVAKRNAVRNHVPINFLNLDFLNKDNWSSLGEFDIIISNPPYIPEADKATMHTNVLDFEPHMALFVQNNNPLIFYTAIQIFADEHLAPKGKIYLEIHKDYGKEVANLFSSEKYDTSLLQDMQGLNRFVIAVRKN